MDTSEHFRGKRITVMGLGLLDEYSVAQSTKIFMAVILTRTANTTTPDPVDMDNTEDTDYNTYMPITSLGVEHVENNVWKFDKIYLRAGGTKRYGWNSSLEKGGATDIAESDEPTPLPFSWRTGVGFVVGNFDLSLSMNPDEWNGVYFLSGAGPEGTAGLVTLTYRFGGESSPPSTTDVPAMPRM